MFSSEKTYAYFPHKIQEKLHRQLKMAKLEIAHIKLEILGDDDETRSRSEDEQSVKSVKDKIAMFEQQFAGDKPIKQYEYQKPDVYRDEDEEMMSSEPLMETSEVVREAMKVSGGSDEDQPQPGMATIADPTLSLGEAAISVASLAGSDIVRDDQERPESEPAKRTKYSTSHETTTTYSMSRKRLGEDGEELEDYEQTGSEIGEMPTPMIRSGHDVEEEPMIRAYASGVEPQTAPEAAPRRISATSTTSSTQIVHQEPQEGSDDDIEADTRIVTKEDGSLQGIEESKDEPEAEYQSMMRRTSSTEPTFTTYRHEQEPVEVREEIDVKMLPSGDTVITEKDTMIQHPIHESPRHSESHRSSDEEEEGPSRGEKALGFMKQAGKIAGAAVAAPVVLAGIGAAKAYDALTRDKSPESEQFEERRFEQESPVGGMKHEPTSETRFTETTTISPEPSETGQRERSSQSDAGDLESSDAGPRRTTLTETTTSYTLSRKHEGHPDEGNIEAETLDELHEHTEPEITESYTRKETFDEEGHPVIIETETHTERRRLSSMSEDKPSHETPQEQEFSRRVEHDLEGNTVITETSTTFIHHSPEEERRSLPESEKFEVSEQQRSGRSSPVVEEPEVEEITTVTKTTITQRPSITSSDLESAEVQRPIEEEPYPQESEFSRIEEIDPSGRTASITESITTRRTSDQEGSDSEHPAEEETIVTRKVEHEPTGDTIITETTTVSRTKRLSQSSEITDIVEPENVETIVQKPPEFTEEPEVEGEYKTEEIRTSTSIQRQPSGEMVVTETKTTTTVIHQPPQMEGDIEEAKEQSPEDDVHRQIGGATIKRSSEHENLSHIGLSGAEKETDIDADLHHHHPEPFSERTVSESHVEDIDKSEDMPRRMSEPDEHEKDLSVERESFDSSHIESPSKQHREGLREELSAPDFEAPQFKDEFRSDVSLPEPRRDSQISDESEGEGPSRGEKALGFMKKAGKIAGAAIAAPAVLAGMGAMKAYEAIKGDGSPEEHREIHREFEQVERPRETQHETKRESSHFEDVQHSPSERRGPSPSEFEVKESYEGRRPESPTGAQRRDSFYQEEQHFELEGPIIHGDVSQEFRQILRKSPSQEEIHREKSPSPQSQRRDSFYQEEQHFEPEGPIIHGDVSEEFRQILKEGPSEEEIHREKSPSQSSIQQKESSPISSPTSTEHRRDSFYQEEQKYEPEGPITHSEVSQEFKQVLREGPSEEELYSSQIHREKSPSISSTKQKESPISSPTSTEHRRDSFYQEEQKFEPEGPIIHGDVSEEFKQILKEGPSEEDIHSESHLEREPLDKEGLPTPEEIKNIIETTAIIEEQTMHEPPHHEGSDLERSSTTEMTSSVSTIVRRSVGSEEAELQQSKDEEHVIDSQRYSEDNEMDRDQFPSIPRDESFKKRSDDESGSDGEDKPEGRGGGAQLIRHEPTSDRPIFETEQLSSEIQPGIVESESYDRELGTQQTHEHEPTSMQTPLSSPVKTTDRESPIEFDYGQSYDRSLQEEPIQKEESRDSLGHIIQSESYDTMKEETERHSPHRSPTASERSLKSFDGEQISQFTPQQQISESSDIQQRQVESVPYEIESEGYGLQHEERGLHSPVRAESPLAEHRRESFGDDVERQQQRVETRQIGEEPTGHIIDSEAYGTHEEEAERKLSGPKSPVLSESSEQGKLLTGRDSESDDEFEEQPKKKGGALEFMKKAGKIAGAAIAAPVVLAGVGAAKAYDALKKEDSPKGSSSYDYSRTPDHPEEFDQSDHEEEFSKGQPESRSHIVESESYEHTFKQDVSSSQDEAKPASYGISEPRRTSFTEETQQQHSPVDIQSGTQRESPIHSPKISPEKIQEDYIIESEDYDQTISQSQELDRPFSPAYTEAKDEVEIRKERDMEQHHKDLSPREGRYTEEYITESQPDHPAVASHIVESESYSSHLRQHDEPDQLPERPDHPISEMVHSSQLSEITAESFSPQHEPTSAHFIESTEYHTQPIETSEVSHISDEKMQSHLDDSQPISKESGWETSYEDKPDIHDYELDYSQGGQPLEERTSSQDEGVGSRPESERSLQHKEEAADLPLESQRSTLETTSSHIEHEQQEFDRQKSPAETPEDQKRYLPTGESYDEIGSDTEEGESSGQKALGFLKKAGKIAGGVIAAPAVLAGVGAVKAYEAIKGDKDEGGQITPTSSPQEQTAYSPSKQSLSRSSLRDDDSTIAGEQSHRPEDIKHVEEIQSFSETLTTDLLQSAKEDISQQAASGKSFLKQESCQEITIEPEVDYQADLQEKLDILASESPLKLDAVREEDGDQLEIIQESEKETDNVIDDTANRLVADVLAEVLDQPDGRGSQASGNESHQYYTATEQSTKGDDQYDTCVTSQEDNYESAQGWTSQDSEYTTATSGANSRLSEMEERQEQTTPLAMLSPVDSDRQFTVSQDYDSDLPTVRIGIDKRFDIQESSTARSTPDVPIQVTIEEEENEYENLPTSPSGVLLAPQVDPGRPVSPIPPPRPTSENDDDDDESAFTFVAKPSEEELIRTPSGGATSAEESEMHERAMDTYSRQLSDVSSSESRADTVIHRKQQDEQSDVVTDVDELSMAELQEEKSATPSSLLQSGSEGEGTHRSEQIPQISEQTIPVEQSFQTEEVEGFVMYRTSSDQDEGEKQQQESELVEGEQQEELETVEEEPEDSDSLNGHGSRGSGSGHSDLSKYKHHSSDNVSLTSLQEFERLEQVLASRGTVPEPGISSSELELYAKLKAANGAATSLSNGSNEGSISSLAEFEKLEAEIVAQQQATAAAQSEEVMMLSDIKEESEVEDMSVKEDDETEEVSDAEVKTKPISQRATPTAPSEADSLERNVMTTSDIVLLETSTDSLEPSGVILGEERRQSVGGSVDRVESQQKRSPSAESLEGFEVVSKMQASTNDSLENIAQEKDSLLEGASQEMTSQDTHGMLSADTMETYGEEDKDSLSGDMENMLERYPTTLTTFETTAVTPDGTVQTISRRVETRVRDPIMSHVAFTGTESEDRLRELGRIFHPIIIFEERFNFRRRRTI